MLESQHSKTLHNFVRYWGAESSQRTAIPHNGEETFSSVPEYLSREAVPSLTSSMLPNPWRGHAGHKVLFNSSEFLLKTEGIFGGYLVHRLTKIDTQTKASGILESFLEADDGHLLSINSPKRWNEGRINIKNNSYKSGISENISRRTNNVLNATYRTNPRSLYNYSGF